MNRVRNFWVAKAMHGIIRLADILLISEEEVSSTELHFLWVVYNTTIELRDVSTSCSSCIQWGFRITLSPSASVVAKLLARLQITDLLKNHPTAKTTVFLHWNPISRFQTRRGTVALHGMRKWMYYQHTVKHFQCTLLVAFCCGVHCDRNNARNIRIWWMESAENYFW